MSKLLEIGSLAREDQHRTKKTFNVNRNLSHRPQTQGVTLQNLLHWVGVKTKWEEGDILNEGL